jgi:hypothetical protein
VHNNVLRAFESIYNDAGFSTNFKMVLTGEGNRRADLEVLNIRVAQQTDLLVNVTLRHDFIGAGRDGGRTHGKLRNPDNPDQNLSPQPTGFFFAGMHVQPYPRRILAPALLPRQQEDRRLFRGPHPPPGATQDPSRESVYRRISSATPALGCRRISSPTPAFSAKFEQI